MTCPIPGRLFFGSVGPDEMSWWQKFWPELETEMQHVDREQANIGQGECQKCNKLAAENNELRMQAELDHACFRQREQDMQAQIDALIAEKKNNLCRECGWDTKHIGE